MLARGTRLPGGLRRPLTPAPAQPRVTGLRTVMMWKSRPVIDWRPRDRCHAGQANVTEFVKRVLLGFRKLTLLVETRFDNAYLATDVPIPKLVGHKQWQTYLYENR